MSENETVATGLTKLDIRALRQCDRVCLHHHENGTAAIRVLKEVKKVGPFDEREKEYEIQSIGSSVMQYKFGGEDSRSSYRHKFQCFSMVSNYHNDDSVWGSIASLLKVEDEIQLSWIGDSNQYSQQAELHHDKLFIAIVRKGKKVYRFMLDDSVCPDNSARMIKWKGSKE